MTGCLALVGRGQWSADDMATALEARDRAALADLRRRCAGVLSDALPREVGGALGLGALQEALLDALTFEAFPDAASALDELRRRGLRLVVVSNWDCSLHGVLEAAGLRRRVDGVLTSAEVGAAKPSPVIFRQALALAGVGASDAIHVGDALAEDVGGARAAGIEPVLVVREGRGGMAPGDIQTIASLAELPALAA